MNDGIKSWDSSPEASESTEANLSQDALTGEKLGAKSDDETKHGKTAIPGFCKIDEAKTRCVVRHVKLQDPYIVTNLSVLLTVSSDTLPPIRVAIQLRALLLAVGKALAGSSGQGCFG